MVEFKFGKKEAQQDERNFQMAALLLEAKVPSKYDVDTLTPGLPVPMFANDQYGCCVISARGHQTLRFEKIEQKKVLKITDNDIITEWRKENGGTDDGLYMLESLRAWRKAGWKAAGKNYKIKAFAQVQPSNKTNVKMTISSNIGIMTGFALPDTWYDEFNEGKAWTDCTEDPNPYNGHCVYITAYDTKYVTCITWGQKQKMSWAFFNKYCDEAYGIIDATNTKRIDIGVLEELLSRVGMVEEDAS